MVNKEQLRDFLHTDGLTRKDQVMLILAVDIENSKAVATIRDFAVISGLREAKNWNISQILSGLKGLAVNTKDGWVLTANGKKYLQDKGFLQQKPTHIRDVYTDLRNHSAKIANPDIQAFLNEAISCLEADLYRAAVILSWIGAVAVLHDYVINNSLAAFNIEAKRRNAKWKDAVTVDDLGLMQEVDFLDILMALSIIGKNVKQELQKCLTLRNGCGHPNSLKISQNAVANHIEILIQNVFSVFV